jgi:ketosteroid isomerase-like protein
VLALALAALTASAQPVSDADARAVREVIEAQLDAFKRDDAPRAFSYAAPGIRATFGTPENFMATDAGGRAWLALYPMEKQPDGSWRINGCQLAPLSGRET